MKTLPLALTGTTQTGTSPSPRLRSGEHKATFTSSETPLFVFAISTYFNYLNVLFAAG